MTWVTNNPKAAMLLKAADAAYERARSNAANLPLAEKVAAYNAAKLIRDAAYAVAAGIGQRTTNAGIEDRLRDEIANGQDIDEAID